MPLHIFLPRVRCTHCENVWTPRRELVKKCPKCQAFDGLTPLDWQTNEDVRAALGTASPQEIRDLAAVLEIFRCGDKYYIEPIKRTIMHYQDDKRRARRAARESLSSSPKSDRTRP
jgi:NAD-dependent SIR2 family protein deacetylase